MPHHFKCFNFFLFEDFVWFFGVAIFYWCFNVNKDMLKSDAFVEIWTGKSPDFRIISLYQQWKNRLFFVETYSKSQENPREKILIVFTFNILFSFPLLRVRLLFCHYKYSIGAQLKSIIQTFFFKLCTIQKSQLYDPFIDEIAVTMYWELLFSRSSGKHHRLTY